MVTAPLLLTIFQSTQPSQAVTGEEQTLIYVLEISIHTALAGCDRDGGCGRDCQTISIHTALAGCDGAQGPGGGGPAFQSTQPSQAVTQMIVHKGFPPTNFNPHSPRRL